jgi:DNA polymerase III alpha subunit
MRINQYGQVVRTEKEAIELLFQNPELAIDQLAFDSATIVEKFNQAADSCDLKIKIKLPEELNIDISTYDKINQQDWFIPEQYQKFNIEDWLYEQCQTEEEFFRVKEELELYEKFNLRQILIISKYLVDEFRKNQIVWGVGRGSSVASFCLYLIGLHKIHSLKYNLDVNEFLK